MDNSRLLASPLLCLLRKRRTHSQTPPSIYLLPSQLIHINVCSTPIYAADRSRSPSTRGRQRSSHQCIGDSLKFIFSEERLGGRAWVLSYQPTHTHEGKLLVLRWPEEDTLVAATSEKEVRRYKAPCGVSSTHFKTPISCNNTGTTYHDVL